MSKAASFAERWARGNLTRQASQGELAVLNLFLSTCSGDDMEAAKRARRYYQARGAGGMQLWHERQPDDEDILSNCQDVYIVPLRAKSVGGRRLTMIRLPAPTAMDKPLSVKAFISRWLMILDIRLKEDPTPGEEIVFVDVRNLRPSLMKNYYKSSYWKDFARCLKATYPMKFSEVHVINAQRLKFMSLFMLCIGLYPWSRKLITCHSKVGDINQALGLDYFPTDGLPFEYGGKAGAMKDLNDEWTKKLLSNSKWLQAEARRFYKTELKPGPYTKTRHRNAVQLRFSNSSYDMITRTHSCKSLYCNDDFDEGTHGAYRTIKVHTSCKACA
ncbi:unnamed protein product [Chilo suppressalis]|uniref:CRAL-TRIO domain-containing protein n=1 Tax=Chilo suppressalis TaxID=168631 RepID=A0ABN8B1N8_CHISP|nr:unnamed protein product [Chilo suppressalis]